MRISTPLLVFLLSFACAASGFAQSEAPVDLRVHNGRLELVFPGGVPLGERLTVATAGGSRALALPLSEGGGLTLVPVNVSPAALATSLSAGQSTTLALTGGALAAQWSVEPLRRPSLPLLSAPAPDSPSTGSLESGPLGMQARLDYAGGGNNYVQFPVGQVLPADASSVGAAYHLDPANPMGILLAYRLTDSRGEFYGAFLPTNNTDAVELTSRPLRSFDYRYGGPPNEDNSALLSRPLTLNSLLFETADHRRKGPARATLFGVFVIRRTQFVAAPAPPQPSVVTVDFARRVPGVHSMSGFLHGAGDTAPTDDLVRPLRPALWRIGNQWLTLRDRLAKLGIPTVLILADNWGRKMPDAGDEWANFVGGMVKKANGYTFIWDVLNEPDLASDYSAHRGTPEKFFPIFVQSSQILHQQIGPNALVSGPSTSHYDRAYLTRFLDYCKAHHARVDVLSWHELDVDGDIPSVEDHLREARRLFVDNPAYKSLGIRQIQVNEIIGPSAQYRPGEILGYFDALERGGADGACKGCWNDSKGGSNCGTNTLDGILMPDTPQPRAAWWAYKAYADTVPSRVLSRSSDRSVVAFAASGDAQGASVVVGAFAYGDYTRGPIPVMVRLQNISRLPFAGAGRRVHVKVEKIPDMGESALPSLPVVREEDAAVAGGVAQVSLPPLAPHEAYRLTLSKAP